MSLDLYSLCGRYGKARGEPFLRRRGTLEPMETPRRYFTSDLEYEEGKTASAAAWKGWNNTRPGRPQKSRSTFFDLLDYDLNETNRLIQGGSNASFDRGLNRGVEKLQERIVAARDASQRLKSERLNKTETAYYLDRQRKGPPILEHILEKLQISSEREKAKQYLDHLCDDHKSISMVAAPSYSSSFKTENYVPSRPPIHHTQTTTSMADPSHPPQHTIHPKDEAFGLGHDPGERQGATIVQGNMYENSTASTRRPESFSRPSNIGPSRTQKIAASRKLGQNLQTLPSTKYGQSISQPEKKTTVQPKGEAFGPGHDSGEFRRATDPEEVMHAESATPYRKPVVTSQPKKQRTYRASSTERPSDNPRLPSYVKTRDFAYERS